MPDANRIPILVWKARAARVPGRGARAAGFLAALALAGCLAAPEDRDGGTDSAAANRNSSVTETYEIPSCTRVWSEAALDSVWNCPNPKPPGPVRRNPG